MTSETFTLTAGQLITNALRDSRIIAAEQPIQPKDLIQGLQAINLVIKHWQAQGNHLWSENEALLPLIPNQRKYFLGPGGDDVALTSTFFNTTLTSALVTTDIIIPVVATSGLNIDGQPVSMSGATDILSSDPTQTIANWESLNVFTTFTASPSGLEITNGLIAAGVTLELETIIGVTYRLNATYTKGTAPSAEFSVFDTTGILATTGFLTVTTDFILEFTARDVITTFQFLNGSPIFNQNSTVFNLNYKDVRSGDRIGIQLDDGSRFWDNILTVDSSTQVTIINGVPSSAAIGNSVYTYGSGIARPMRVLDTRFGETLTASEIPVKMWSRQSYFDQPDKNSSGTVVNVYYSPVLTRGELYVWQVANNINQVLRITYVDVIDIPTNTSDPLDFPSEWLMPLKWAVAAEMAPSRGVPDNRQIILESKAAGALNEVLGFDVERESMSLQPDFN